MQENTKPLLEEKKIPDPFIQYKTELTRAYEGSSAVGILGKIFGGGSGSPLLTKENAALGLSLINQNPAHKETESHYSNICRPAFNGERYKSIKTALEDNWSSGANYNLLIFFLGKEKAEYARHAWNRIQYQMYQAGSHRRSFRSPEDRNMYFQRQLDFIIYLLRQSFNQRYEQGYKYEHYDLTITEQIQFNHVIGDYNPELFRLWSAAIDLGNKEVLQQLEDVVYNKDPHGKLTRSIIKALLNSELKEAWVIVEKLLLAAQREEGLRQTILEALDETSLGALKYMIRVIIERDLARFSSVVRAIDVWAGLGWESERETTVRNFLEKASKYLEDQDAIPDAIRSDNNTDVYMALWALAVHDVEKTIPYLHELYRTGDTQKRTLAVMFAVVTNHNKLRMPMCIPALEDKDLQPLAIAVTEIYASASIAGNEAIYNKSYPKLFDQLYAVYQRVTVKQKTFEGVVFSWNKIIFDRKTILQAMLALTGDDQGRLEIMINYLDDMDTTVKSQLNKKILPEYSKYTFVKEAKSRQPLTTFQRKFALMMLRDRSEFNVGFNALREEMLTAEELAPFADWLKRKGADFRGNILTILLRQENHKLSPIIGELLQGDGEQRAAALDILLQLKKANRILPEAAGWVTAFHERKVSPKEEILLAQLTETGETKNISAANGFDIYDPAKCAPVIRPAIDPTSEYEQFLAQKPYALSMPVTRIAEAMNELGSLIEQHANHEYEVMNYGNTKETVLLGNAFRPFEYQRTFPTPREKYQTYPLPEVWEAWYDKWQFEPRDLEILLVPLPADNNIYKQQLPHRRDFIPEKFLPRAHHYANPFLSILNALNALHSMEHADEFFLAAATRLFASLGEDELKIVPNTNSYSSRGAGWQQNSNLHFFSAKIKPETMDEKLVPLYWNLFHWRQYSGREEYIPFSMPPLIIFCRAYEQGVINEHDMLRSLLHPDNIRVLSAKTRHPREFDFYGRFPFLLAMFDSVREQLLDIEVKRGDTPTPVTPLVARVGTLFGVQRLTQLMAGLGKTTLLKGYYYYGGANNDKQTIFSNLIKFCHPRETDAQEQFDESMKRIKATEPRLIEIAVYAPQWQRFVRQYLGWEGLDNAIWWMHAHTKTDGYRAQNAEAESEIARYSSLDVEEFKEGAVDKDWFNKAYAEIGPERWAIVYDAAKYITDGNGHRRARIYADVLVGNLNLKEVTEKITAKRDQDYVRIYGLAPLKDADVEKDILFRYEFIQEFKKGSRQFGAQKQASEAAAIKVAMDNLARNAGYPDPIRLTWAMETRQVQAILAKETQLQIDDVLIGLVIDEEGEAEVVAFKDDKQLKAIPAKYKKDTRVEELNGFKKVLREQFRRSKKGLEEAMVRGDIFLYKEIRELFTHPVIARHLEKLVFILEGRPGHGYYKDHTLVDDQGEVTELTDADTLRIAHCVDLYETKSWAGYQRLSFDRKLQQPFKQIFRELYLPTPDELKEISISRRYAGHQIQPKQTVALLRSRGWKVNYEEGLQKVFHKEGFSVQMYAMADWFSPAEMESPTLETVIFHDLKTFKAVAFTSIHPRIFSEVMRDMDLVVSVAHAGGVDPEASHSSIEMRAVLLKETIRLFKLDNVTVDGSHALIKGTMGEYSVHLGSAVVHRVLSGYLSILPVHSQHRGRIFLPFVDDDPRSAELLSKVLLLARDKDLKDPLILQQLQ